MLPPLQPRFSPGFAALRPPRELLPRRLPLPTAPREVMLQSIPVCPGTAEEHGADGNLWAEGGREHAWSPPSIPACSFHVPKLENILGMGCFCRQCWFLVRIGFDSSFYSAAAAQGALPGPVQSSRAQLEQGKGSGAAAAGRGGSGAGTQGIRLDGGRE